MGFPVCALVHVAVVMETACELVEIDASYSIFWAFDVVDGHFAVSGSVSSCEHA
jgi:hypothetical protein